jgi:1-acyl-sn-glycerol-3-phosphate acyltransferase
LQTLRDRLLTGSCAYVLFPEGTRSRDGVMARFKPGVGMLVAGSSMPVVPCHLQGTFDSLPAHGKIPRPARITLRFGKAHSFSDASQDREGWNTIGSVLEQAVRTLGGA